MFYWPSGKIPAERIGVSQWEARLDSGLFHLWVTMVIRDFLSLRVLPAIMSDLMHSEEDDYSKADSQSCVTFQENDCPWLAAGREATEGTAKIKTFLRHHEER